MNTAIVAMAEYGIFLAAVIALGVWLRVSRAEKLPLAVQAVIGVGLAVVLAKASGYLWTNPRPFVVDHLPPLLPHAADNGFPSDHSAVAAAAATVVTLYRRVAGLWLWVLALLIGGARVLARVHHWPDIIGGLAVGALSVGIAVLIAGPLLRRFARSRESVPAS